MTKIKLKPLAKQGAFITLNDVLNDLLVFNHNKRITLFRNKVEQGTTIPYVLFALLKSSLLQAEGLDKESKHSLSKTRNSELDKRVQKILRHILIDIYAIMSANNISKKEVLIAKTLQQFVFKKFILKQAIRIDHIDHLVLNKKSEKSHTVSGMVNPSFTLPTYLCEYLLVSDGLNVNTELNRLNPVLKKIGGIVYDRIKSLGDDVIHDRLNFSRCVQYEIIKRAINEHFEPAIFSIKIKNPEK